MRRARHLGWYLALFAAMMVACSSDDTRDAFSPMVSGVSTPTSTSQPSVSGVPRPRPTPDLSAIEGAIREDLQKLIPGVTSGFDHELIRILGQSGDIRNAWFVSDMLRFASNPSSLTALEQAFAELAGVESDIYHGWPEITNYLLAQDIPAPEGYQSWKRAIYLRFGPAWAPFFSDPNADVDWRLIGWGGVAIDDRPIDPPNIECNGCIPALNDPVVTSAAGGDWYPEEALVFGLEVNGETRAYPRHQMEVHEMVNDTIGGRRIAVVYCTLCGSAQAFFTDNLPAGVETPTGTFELRTSGLLSRSNKVMFEFHTDSYFDTFLGRAVSGPLHKVGLVLEPISVSIATWKEWKEGQPGTTIIARDGGIGFEYSLDPLGGRDDGGPIFPIGQVDPRVPVQDLVLGVVHGDLTVAFPEIPTRSALLAGDRVEYGDVVVEIEAGALQARAVDGDRIATHQAFWFAWSQFRPETRVWGID